MPDREKVIKGIQECNKNGGLIGNCPYKGIITLLKEQEAKTGHWIEKEDYFLDTYYDCSVCGESWSTIDGTPWENGMNYCPHCGAKMERR